MGKQQVQLTSQFDLGPRVCFLGITGSHAYGMARDDSDVDVRGCCIPPRVVRDSPFRHFKHWQHKATGKRPELGEAWGIMDTALRRHPTAQHYWKASDGCAVDLEIDALGRLVYLMADANPNKLEFLFLDPGDILHMTDAWATLRACRHLFLSTKVRHSYSGYAHSQLKRIKGHRAWLMDPPKKEPTRADFDLPESTVLGADDRNRLDEAIRKIIRDWGVEDGLDDYITGAAQDVLRERMRTFQATALQCSESLLDGKTYELAAASLGLTKDVLYALKQERAYRAARKDWAAYQKWQRERNEARARLEADFGFDVKHGAHLIRLLRMGLEILEGKGVLVRRPDADELLDIRRGHYSYDDLLAEAHALEARMKEVYPESSLPREPDAQKIEDLYLEILDRHG